MPGNQQTETNEDQRALVVGLDLGTTNCKAAAVSAQGEVVGVAAREYVLRTPRPGWAEQQADDVWRCVVETLLSLAGKLPERQFAGLCLSGAMHSVLIVDAKGQPLAPAMTWADQRAAAKTRELRSRTDAHALYERTGCPLQSIYYPAKLRWWIEEAPEIARQAARFVALKDWVLYQLTGQWFTDFGLASTTGLLDIRRLDWDEEALALAGVGAEQLPRLAAPTAIAGWILEGAYHPVPGAPGRLELQSTPLAGLPVIAGSSDGGLANLGAGAMLPGQNVITVGTSGAVRRLVDEPLLDPQERTWCYVLEEGHWFAGGAINNGGLALQWIREKFYPRLSGEAGFEQLLEEAARIPPGAGGVFLLPYFTGERSPHWDPEVRALLAGLRLEHNRGHIARAALEGVAFCLADVWEALNVTARPQEPVRLTGGITRAPLWAQILADVLGVRLAIVEAADASAVGAALMGQRALGIVTQAEMLQRAPLGQIFEPDPERHAFYRERHADFQRLYRQIAKGYDLGRNE